MSGGFFRGTSADQDTRFSNKQAKLMKSQKFAPELEHLVEMTKVKMDVIKPWIATRVTELLGFEDEVLINFIYGLLDRKNVNGKEVQIQLTGFMEKNTGKFMKELWILLLSAQKNASGIPQQFLDAKEEETKKKKAEADRITHEILKKKEREGRELEQDKLKKMDVEVANAVSDPISKHSLPRASSIHREEEKEADERNGSERKNRISRSPLSADRSSSPHRSTRSRSRSKSLSNSRSYSGERHISRGISGSPQPRGHSSPDSFHRSPRNRSISPDLRYSPRRPRSPFRRRSPHSRHRSSSYSRHRSPSPVRRRSPSPVRRRSPSPMRRRLPSPSCRRSPSPYRRRLPSSYRRRSPSPYRRRSPSPVRRRSPPPMRRRSPSPLRRRSPSPMRRRSPIPVRRRSPTSYRRRSPSPLRRSPPPPRGSPSPVRRSPFMKSPRRQRRSPVRSPRQRKWSRSPYRSRSPAYQNRRSFSRDHDIETNGAESSRHRDAYAPQRTHRIISPVLHASEREEIEHSGEGGKQPGSLSRRPPISLRSPQRDPRDQSDTRENRIVQSPSPGKSPSPSDSSPRARRTIPSKNRRYSSPSESPVRQRRERITHDDSRSPVRQVREKTTRHDNPETSRVDEELSHSREKGGYRIHSSKAMRPSPVGSSKRSPIANLRRDGYPPESDRSTGPQSTEPQGHPHNMELRKKDQERRSEKASMRKDPPERLAQPTSHSSEKIEYGPGVTKGRKLSLDHFHDEQPSTRQLERDSPSTERLHKSYLKESDKPHEKKRSHSIKIEEGDQLHKKGAVQRSMKKDDQNEHNRASDSESEENKIYKSQGAAKRKPKRLDRHGSVSDDDAGFEIDERKDAKRRRKEEKKLRKEERRRRREERHRKKEERRASKLKTKSMDTVTPPSDFEKDRDVDSDSDVAVRRKPHPSDTEEAESEQKKLEIELRKKALESLRAKKGIGS